jgi:hypothetical protein
MGYPSTYEKIEDRRHDAVHLLGVELTENRKRRAPRTSLETTQQHVPCDASARSLPSSFSAKRMEERRQRRIDQERRQLAWRKEMNLIRIEEDNYDSPLAGVRTDTEDKWPEHTSSGKPTVKVCVERLMYRALDRSGAIWLQIGPFKGDRESLRPANENDRCVLSAEYPGFFSEWFDGPQVVSCLAEWIGKEWFLLPASKLPTLLTDE